ncbi:hypothetical protein, partial [Arcobacter sp. LA11]|uniref:hypothetical protein n=1 Tax=Arcobacter sp. LA11 TaxID=1898176 RepID=UPI000AFA94BA
ENEASFVIGFTVTDGDGDKADGNLTLLIDDDTPTVLPTYDSVMTNNYRIISDDDTARDVTGNQGGNGDSGEWHKTGNLVGAFSAGADGGTVAWNAVNSSNESGDLTPGITFEIDPNTGSLSMFQQQGTEKVQIVEITMEDTTTGQYTYTQINNLLHVNDGQNTENDAKFLLGFTVTDGDGDKADGKLQLIIDDDTPTVVPYETNTMRIISDDDTVAGLNGNSGYGNNPSDGA